MNETLITLVITAVLIGATVIPYLKRFNKKESKARAKLHQMQISGLQEATTVHPQIDALLCIGCAACVKACPEGEVLGIIEGKATLIHGAKCIGHGLCAEACPVGGIQLLMAKPGRSADLPIIQDHYETTVKGLFIVGELGGLGLIKNAIRQGTEVMQHIATLPTSANDDVYDVAIIGAGPSGFAAGLTALEKKMRYIILEQNDIGGTVLQYPRAKVVMTSPVDLPMWGKIKLTTTRKEALLDLWQSVIKKTGLKIRTGEKVTDIQSVDGCFTITATTQSVKAKYVILALGRRGTPRKLGVSGEQLSKVTYRLIDASSYNGNHVLVVGGGDSAIEAAIGLASQKNNTVTLSYRKSEFSRIKERNRIHIGEFMGRKKVKVLFNSEVKDISETTVVLQTTEGEQEFQNDYVFIFAGGELPSEFLKKIGVNMHMQQVA
ncbi:MAG: NAD(P)-binding domain-containing protein [Bacteroidota bacterium]|nr:NAD(P)-binding domain-containing protein [Bacteroidota bacterium]